MTRSQILGLLLPFTLLTAACAAETDPSATEPTTTVDGTTASSSTDPADTDDEDVGEQADDLTAALTYPKVKSIINSNCGGCHADFKTLAGIKPAKTAMIAKLTAGAMPKGNPGFKSTAKGKKLLKWLKTGADLQ